MPPRSEEEVDVITLHNQALMNMEEKPTEGFEKLQFLLQQGSFPPEAFANLLILYCKYEVRAYHICTLVHGCFGSYQTTVYQCYSLRTLMHADYSTVCMYLRMYIYVPTYVPTYVHVKSYIPTVCTMPTEYYICIYVLYILHT